MMMMLMIVVGRDAKRRRKLPASRANCELHNLQRLAAAEGAGCEITASRIHRVRSGSARLQLCASCGRVWGRITAPRFCGPCLPPSAREPEIGVLRRKAGYMMKGCGVTGSGDASVTIRA